VNVRASRESLKKAAYGRLFSWRVEKPPLVIPAGTGCFILYGATKSNSRSGMISAVVFVICGVLALYVTVMMPVVPSIPIVDTYFVLMKLRFQSRSMANFGAASSCLQMRPRMMSAPAPRRTRKSVP